MSRRDDEFTAFVDRARPTLLRTAWLLTGEVGEAEELVQEALVRTYVAWPRVRPDTATAYARTIVARLHVDQGRRSAREQVRDVVPERGATDAYREDEDEVLRLLRRLPPRQRAVVVLRYYADHSEQEVARALGISVGGVKSAASRGLATLRDLLDDTDSPAPTPSTSPKRSLR